MKRRGPLTPIYNPDVRRGAIVVGNTPGTVVMRLVLVGQTTHSTELNGPNGIAAYGDYLVTVNSASTTDRLTVVDASVPAALAIVGSTTGANFTNPEMLAISGDYAFVSCNLGWTFVVDLSTPSSPSIVGSVQDSDFGAGSCGVAASGTLGFLARDGRFGVVDFSTPASPTFVADHANAAYGFCTDLVAVGSHVFTPDPDTGSVRSVDVSTPASPSIAGSVTDLTVIDAVSGVRAFGASHVLAVNDAGYVVAIDISTPASPTIAGTLDLSSWFFLADVAAVGSYVVVLGSDNNGYPTLALVDWSTVASPVVVDVYFDTTGAILDNPEYLCPFNTGVAVTDSSLDRVLVFGIA